MRLAEAEGVKHASGVRHPKMGTIREGPGLPTKPDLSPVTRDYPSLVRWSELMLTRRTESAPNK
jgi:hypothetical protein